MRDSAKVGRARILGCCQEKLRFGGETHPVLVSVVCAPGGNTLLVGLEQGEPDADFIALGIPRCTSRLHKIVLQHLPVTFSCMIRSLASA